MSSPSDLGIRLGVSAGTSVDPWIVRPIKGALEEVATRLVSALYSVHTSVTEDKSDIQGGVDDFLHKLRSQETIPFHMHHIADDKRGWCRIHSNVWIHSIVCPQSGLSSQ